MRILAVALLLAAAPGLAAQVDAEAKKKRLAEIVKQMGELHLEGEKLLNELSGGDPDRKQAILRETMEKHAPKMAAEAGRSQIASNERNASSTLTTLASAEADFRANDRDANNLIDFWVADVSALYRIVADEAIKLIEVSVAHADAKPCVPLEKEGKAPGAGKDSSKLIALGKPSTKAGYWFAAVENFQDTTGATVKYDPGNGRNNSKFGFCTYPAEHGKTGKFTFILNEKNTVWKKDTGGQPVSVYPADPAKDGWSKLD